MCERCGVLAAENAQLKDELAEWRRQAEAATAHEDAAVTMQVWRSVLGVDPRVLRCVRALVERAGRVVGHDTLAAAIVGVEPDHFEGAPATARVAVCHLRRAFQQQGLNVEIQSLRGAGYLMPRPDAARLVALVEAAA